MDKLEIISQLKSKYTEIFPKFWSVYLKKKEEPKNLEILKIYNYLHYNIKYIEKYLSIMNLQDETEIQKEIEKNNLIKELNDALYEPKEETQNPNNPKIQEIN